MIFGLEELHQLVKMKGFYYTSGLVVVIYPKDETAIGKQYTIIKNILCGKEIPLTKKLRISYYMMQCI